MPSSTQWRAQPASSVDDPFSAQIEDVGTPIQMDAEGRSAELQRELVDTLAAEGVLWERDVECELKRHPEVTCHACPLRVRDDSPAGQLCALGIRQEQILTELRARHFGRQR